MRALEIITTMTPSAHFSGDLLENYCYDDMNLARVLFCVSILLTFPLECFVSREVSCLSFLISHLILASPSFFMLQLNNFSIFILSQIIKTQIKRFYSHEIVEYDRNVDPRKREDSEDKV